MTETKKATDIILGVFFVGVLIAILILAAAITFSTLNTAGSNIQSGSISSFSVINETGAWINSTIDPLNILLTKPTAQNCLVTNAFNSSSNLTINAGNYTVFFNCTLKNASALQWNTVTLSYTYDIYTSSTSVLNSSIQTIQGSVFGMAINFFSLMPIIGTILAVVVLISIIVILVVYVKKMKDSGSNSERGFRG